MDTRNTRAPLCQNKELDRNRNFLCAARRFEANQLIKALVSNKDLNMRIIKLKNTVAEAF